MSKSKVIASETVFGESTDGYQTAIASAISHEHLQSNASCEINIILFDMHFENGKFMVSIQVVVNEISLDIEDKNLDELSLEEKDKRNRLSPAAKKKAKRENRLSDLIDLLEFSHYGDALMEFNNQAIYDHLATSLDHTWEIHPHSQAYKDIHDIISQHLDVPYKDIRLYTQAVDNIAQLIPENTGFTRHFVDFAMEQQRHDLMQQMMNNNFDHRPSPRNDNHAPKPSIATQWDDK